MSVSSAPVLIASELPAKRSQPNNILFDYIRFPACKRLISQIYMAQKEQNIKSITVLSQFPGEGKTVLISMLALGFMSLLDKRVLIMDTVSQTREESFYYKKVLGNLPMEADDGAEQQGRIDLITSKNLTREMSLPQRDELESEIDNSAYDEDDRAYDSADFQIGPFVDSMKRFYDLILLDSCALSHADKNSFDPLILAQQTDTSVLVAAQSSLEREKLTKLTRELKRHRITPLGIIVDAGIA